MTRKHRNTSSPEPFDEPSPKRQKSGTENESGTSDSDFSQEDASIDYVYGQVGAFPGLGKGNNELFYGPAANGVEYLQMVRSEARSVPLILTSIIAPRQFDTHSQGDVPENSWDVAGFYAEQAVIAPAIIGTAGKPSRYSPAQVRYHKSLLTHFRSLRDRLLSTSISDDRQSQTIAHSQTEQLSTSLGARRATPSIPQVMRMSEADKLDLIQALSQDLRSLNYQDREQVHRMGAWCWALLGSFNGLETLSSEELAEVRELAKSAAGALDRLLAGEASRDKTEAGVSGESIPDNRARDSMHSKRLGADSEGTNGSPIVGLAGEEQDREGAPIPNHGPKSRLSHLRGSASIVTMSMVSDMILTVVGEVYGQRDLLDLRLAWPTAANGN